MAVSFFNGNSGDWGGSNLVERRQRIDGAIALSIDCGREKIDRHARRHRFWQGLRAPSIFFYFAIRPLAPVAATVIDRSVENKNKNDKRTKGTSAKLVPLSATRSPGKDPGTLGIDGPTSFVAMATAAGRFCESITRPRVSLTSVRVCVLPSFFFCWVSGFGAGYRVFVPLRTLK